MFRTISVTSSRTPATLLNSCSTPSIWTAVTAAPCKEDNRIRRMALPSVMPKPRSRGSATTVAARGGSAPGSTSSFSGLIRDCQFLWITALCLMLHLSNRPPPCAPAEDSHTPGQSGRAGPDVTLKSSNATTLARPASVVRDRCHVADRGNREADGLQRTQCAFASRTGPADFDLQRLQAMFPRLAAGILGGNLRRIGGRLAAALETLTTS